MDRREPGRASGVGMIMKLLSLSSQPAFLCSALCRTPPVLAPKVPPPENLFPGRSVGHLMPKGLTCCSCECYPSNTSALLCQQQLLNRPVVFYHVQNQFQQKHQRQLASASSFPQL